MSLHNEQQRQIENFAIACPLKDIEDPDMLAFVAHLIQDHDHLREKLMTELDGRKRTEKLEAMRPHLNFRADTSHGYEMAELALRCGSQPIYAEQEQAERSRIIAPPSFVHEARG